MNTVGISASNNHLYGQPRRCHSHSVGQTKHWTQSRTVRNWAGMTVLAVGALAGVVTSFFAGPIAVMIATAVVGVVVGVAVVSYFNIHRRDKDTETTSRLHTH